jgi:hypothetical protein
VKNKQESKATSDQSTSQTSLSSDKIEPNPSQIIFPFTLNPTSKTISKKKLNQEPQTKIFQHVVKTSRDENARAKWQRTPPKAVRPKQREKTTDVSKEDVPENLEAFLADPNKLSLYKPEMVEKIKKKLAMPVKEPSPQKPDYELPLQVCFHICIWNEM